MKFPALASALLVVLLLMASLPSAATAGERGGWMRVEQRPQQPQYDRQYQQPPRRNEGMPQNPQNPQRMSPDERRQLRRDLRDAGRDVYPQRRDRRQ